MAIGNHNDLTHIVRTSDQWKNTYDKYELIPTGVLCVELVSPDVTKIKIGDGHNIFSKLPYIGDLDLSKYYTKLETDTRIKEILTQEKVVRIKGLIGSKSDLPAEARCGDIYFVRQLSSSDNKYIEYIYSPDNTWEPLGGIPVDIDLSEYAKTAYVDDKIEQVNERIDDIEQHGTHTHPNKEILDQITEPYTTADKETLASLHNYDDTEIREMISQSSHTHSNKDILDATSAAFTREDKSKLDQLNPYDDSTIKERITELERVAHEHSNKRILDQTTASFTKEYERKMRWIRMYTGCTGMEEGIAGLVPAAQAGEEDYVLSGSGEWVPQTGGGGTYELPIATASTLGGIKVGDGLEIDENGVLSATGGGGGGDSIAEGDGITITTDPQTGVKTISVNTGDHLSVDSQTGELNVSGVMEEFNIGKGLELVLPTLDTLPAGYGHVDYVKTSGAAYAELDYYVTVNTKVVGTATCDVFNNDAALFGARQSIGHNEFVMWMQQLSNDPTNMITGFVYGSNNWGTSTDANGGRTAPYHQGDQYNFEASVAGGLKINNQLLHNVTNYGDPAYTKLHVFACNGYGGGIYNGKMYQFKLYENDTLSAKLIPAVRLSDNAVGFYDVINDDFYTSSASTPFTTDMSTLIIDDPTKVLNAKIGNGLRFDSNNAIEVNTGDGLQINQDGEVEIDPSIIPDITEYRAGEAIDIKSITRTLEPTTFSNIDYIASFSGAYNGRIEKNADGTEFTITATGSDAYTEDHIGSESNGSYPYNVESSTKYRLTWDATGDIDAGGIIIFENGGYDIMHNDYASAEYIEFTTSANTTFFTMRCGVLNNGQSITFSNFNLYRVLEEALEYDEISVKYNKGLTVNQDNELEVNAGDGLTTNSDGELEVNAGRALSVNGSGELGVDIATANSLGVVKAGSGLNIDEFGNLSTQAAPFRIGRALSLDDESVRLPSAYYKAKYVQSDGDARCSTGFYPSNYPNAKYVGTASVIGDTNGYKYIFGTQGDNYRSYWSMILSTSNDNQSIITGLTYNNNNDKVNNPITTSFAKGDMIDFEASITSGLKLNNELVQSLSTTFTKSTYNMFIFGEQAGYTTKARIYSFKIYNSDDTLLANFVPAVRKSDNEVGFYETVSNQFINSNYYGPPFTTDMDDLDVDEPDWVLNADIATANSLGVIKPGTGLTVSPDGTLNATPYTLPTASASTLGGVKVGDGLSIAADGTLSATGGGSSGGGPEYVEGDAIEIDTQPLSFNVDAIRWDISDVKSTSPYTQVRSVEFCDSSNVAHTLDSGSVIWEDGTTVTYPSVSETIDELVADTGKMCAVWRYPNHVLKLTFNLDTPASLSDIVKFRMKTANDSSERDPKAWKIYVRNATTQEWYLVHETSNAEITGTRDTWSNYYTFTPVTETSINVNYGNGLTVNQNNELEINTGDGLSVNANNEVELSKATANALGGIKVGSGFVYTSDGLLNATPAAPPFDAGDGLELIYDDIDALPNGYGHVDYVCSNPENNLINAHGRARTLIDYIPTNTTKLAIKMQRDSERQDLCFIGSRIASRDHEFCFWNEYGSVTELAFTYGSTNYSNAYVEYSSYITGQIIEVECVVGDTSNTLSVNGTVVKTYTKSGDASPYKLGIFQLYLNESWGNQPANGKIYYIKLYEGDTLAVNLIPAVRLVDEAVGFYDNISDKFYTSNTEYPFTTDMSTLVIDGGNRTLKAKLGNGLRFDSNNAIEVIGGSGETYEAGNGIEITEVTHEDEFRVQNQEYFFTDHGLTCIITGNYGPRTYTKINDGDIVAAVIGKTGGWYMPLFVGLTEDSVKYSNSYDSNILGPTGSFTYHDKTWYYTADYALTAGDGVDHAGHLQSITNTIYDGAEGEIQAAKDLIDLAVLLPDVSVLTINAKIGAGLSFDANGAIQADAQPLSPATDSTLGGVIVGEGINVDEYGEISLSAGEGLDIDFESHIPSEYTLVKGISSVGHNDLPYINTGYLIKPTSRIIMRGVLYKTTGGWTFPIGVRHNNYSNPVMFCTHHESNGDSIELWLPNDTLIASATDREKCYNDPVTITISSDGLNIENETTGEVVTLTTSDTLPIATLPLYIFATNDNYTLSFPGSMDLYRLQIFEGTTKVLDYLPCKRNSDNKYGVYDIVANEYKASSNAALFEPVAGTPSGDDLIQQIKLLPATKNTIGGVIVGDGILVDNDGTISVDPTIIPEITEYEAGTAISIEDVEHGGATFDAWDSGTGWENVCYQNSTGNAVVTYTYEAHSPISNSYTLPAGATHIRAIAYDQNDTMLWTSFSWIDANNYHFASTSPEDGHYNDWFDIPEGSVKVNFGVRHSKLNTSQSMNLNDIKSVDITIQTISEIEVDVWTGVTGWTNGDYYSGTSDTFTRDWYYTYHYDPTAYIPVPEGALKIRVIGISNENDSRFEGGGANIFDSNHHHIGWLPCCTATGEWVDIPEGTVYVQPEVKWNNNNTRTISAADIKSVTLAWKLPALEINQAINVKYGNGLTVNQNNELEVNLGSGLQFDANGAIEVTGGSGGDTIVEGDGISITDDQQTGDKIISVNYGDGLTIDPVTGALMFDGQLPEGTIIKKLTYMGDGGATNNIQFEKKPIAILSIYGAGQGTKVSSCAAPIDAPVLNVSYGTGNGGNTAGIVSCTMSYNDTTNVLSLTGGNDPGVRCNMSGETYTVYYLIKGHTEGGTSATNEVSVIKTITYTGTGTSTNAIQFPETPDFILSINGKDGVSGDMVVFSFDNLHPSDAHQYIYTFCYNAGISSNYFAGGHGTFDFNPTTNVLTLTGADSGAACNYLDRVYYLRYVVNETISGGGGSGDSIAEGDGITITTDSQTGVKTIGINVGDGLEIDPLTNELFVNGQLPEGTIIKKLTYVGDGSTTNSNIHFSKKPLSILSLNGLVGQNYGSVISTPIDAPYLHGVWGGSTGSGTAFRSPMSYDDTTNTLSIQNTSDIGLAFNISGVTYTMYYLTKGHTGSGTSVNNEVSVIKSFTYVGDGTNPNNIQFPETPDMLVTISAPGGDNTRLSAAPSAMDADKLVIDVSDANNNNGVIGCSMSFNSTTNVLTLSTTKDISWCLNMSGTTYTVFYAVNEVIASVTPYAAGEAISIETIGGLQPTNYSNNDFVDSIVSMNAGSIVKAADKSSFTLTASGDDCYTRGSSGQANGSYPFNVKASTKYRFAWDSADPTVHGKVYTYENGLYDAMMHEIDQYDSSYLEFTTSPNTTFIQARFGVMYAGDSITYSNVRLYEVIEDEDQYNEISVKHGDGLTVNNRNELEVRYGNGLEIVSNSQYRPAYYFNTRVQCQVHTDSYYSTSASFDRTYQKTTTEPALCCIWEVGDSGAFWTGPLLVGTTATSVQYTTQDTQQTVTYQNTFQYLGQTWYTSGYPDFINAADHEDKLGYLQYLGSYPAVTDQIRAAKDLIDLALINAGSLQAKLGSGLSFDANGAIQVTGGGGSSGDTVAEGSGIEITTDQQTGNKVIAVNAGTGLQVDQTTNELEIDDSVVTEDDELNLVFVPDDYQPS